MNARRRSSHHAWTLRVSAVLTLCACNALLGSALADGSMAAGASDPDTGAIYIYEREGAEWPLRRTLLAPEPTQRRGFGAAVACTTKLTVVGAPNVVTADDVGGALFVFE